MVDAMGSFSPIANQSRLGAKPDSVVLMVGSCAEGMPECSVADLLYSFTPLNRQAFAHSTPPSFHINTTPFSISVSSHIPLAKVHLITDLDDWYPQ